MPKKNDSAQKLSKTKAPKPTKAKVSASAPIKKNLGQGKVDGRPSSYRDDIALIICTRLSQGESLRSICNDEALPTKTSVFRWLDDEKRKDFRDQYARAREQQADFYAEQIVEISDEECVFVDHGDGDDRKKVEVAFDSALVARNRLRVDARKWYASKLAPKKYGEKQTIDLNAEVITMTEDQRKARIVELQAKINAPTS